MNIGYVNNSSRNLNHVKLDKIFTDIDNKRTELKKCFEFIKAGDTLHVTHIESIFSNMYDLKTVTELMTKKESIINIQRHNTII